MEKTDYAGAAVLQKEWDDRKAAAGQDKDSDSDTSRAEGSDSDLEEASEEEDEAQAAVHQDLSVLRMLYKGNVEEVDRGAEQARKGRVVSAKHTFYKNTRCTSTAQEEQSALPALESNTRMTSSRPATTPIGMPPPTTLPIVVMSGAMP